MKKNITIKDIAQQLNIHNATVSRALQNNPLVKKETRDKVQKLAKELNYRPNILAQNMRMKQSKTIGVVVPNIESEFFAKIISGIESTMYDAGYNIIIYQTGEDFEKEDRVLNVLLSLQIGGLIACFSKSDKVPEYLELLENENVESVLFDRVSSEDKLNTNKVIIDNYRIFYEVTDYVINSGRKKIAFFSGREGIHAFEDRIRAYKDALIQNGLDVDEALVCRNVINAEDVEKCINNLSQKNIDSLIITNEKTTIETMIYLKEKRYEIPGNILPVGAENHIISAMIKPSIPMIRYDSYKMGIESAKLLINSINQKRSERLFETRIIEAKLIV